jgi:hypothetical protein
LPVIYCWVLLILEKRGAGNIQCYYDEPSAKMGKTHIDG